MHYASMTRTKKKPPIELVDATYDDVINEFCKEFDLPPQASAAVLISTNNPISLTAVHIAIDAGLRFGKKHSEKVVINLPPSPPPLPSPPSLDELRTRYVG